jgi:hypothetical protein
VFSISFYFPCDRQEAGLESRGRALRSLGRSALAFESPEFPRRVEVLAGERVEGPHARAVVTGIKKQAEQFRVMASIATSLS